MDHSTKQGGPRPEGTSEQANERPASPEQRPRAHGAPGDAASSTYGGLGGDGPYGTHGLARGGGGYDMDERQAPAEADDVKGSTPGASSAVDTPKTG